MTLGQFSYFPELEQLLIDDFKTKRSENQRAASELEGIECWSARELQELLGYSKWENFEKVIQKAKDACTNAGEEVDYHFPDVRKTITMPKGAEKEIYAPNQKQHQPIFTNAGGH